MAHFAKINSSNIVEQVIAVHNNEAPDEATGVAFCKSLYGASTNWVQTSYNANFRFRFAGIGFTWDAARDAFIAPKPFPSWVLNEETADWEAPIPVPENGLYIWNEELQRWDSA